MSDVKTFPTGECSYCTTQRSYANQVWYRCNTCKPGYWGYGCCLECSKVCHAGHELSEQLTSGFYCDCGAGGLLPVPEKCKITPPVDYEKITKYEMESWYPKFQEEFNTLMTKPIPVNVDWDSFRIAASPESTYYQLRYWYGERTYKAVMWTMEALIKDNGTDKLSTLSEVRFIHVNEGRPDEEKCVVENNVLKITTSFCCYYHNFDRDCLSQALTLHFSLFEGYKKKVNEAIKEGAEKVNNVPVEVDWDSFEYPEVTETREAQKKKCKAYVRAAEYYAYSSVRPITDAFYWSSANVQKEEITRGFTKFVIHNQHMKMDPNGKPIEAGVDGRHVKYNIAAKELHTYSVFEYGSYWWCCQYYEVREATDNVIRIGRLGEFNTMTTAQHDEKIQMLENVCTSWNVYRGGDFSFMKDLLQYRCFYPKDNHERQAFVNILKFINAGEYRPTIMEDTRIAENENLVRRGLPADKPEVFVAGWLTTKINYKGMKQDRLFFVTDMACYSAAPEYKTSKPDVKRLHRYAHQYYSYCRFGKLCYTTAGVPSVNVPGGGMASRLAAKAGSAASSAEKLAGKLPGDGSDSPDAPPSGFKLYTNRLVADDKPKKKFKMPTIPNLKENLCKMLRSMIDAIKSVEMPKFELPGLPDFDCPSIMDLVSKCKPKRPSLPGLPEGASLTPPTGPGQRTEYSCAPGSFPNTSQDELPKVKDELAKASLPRLKLPFPDFKPGELLGKVVEKVEAMGEFIIDLPAKFGFMDMLSHFGKAIGKATGLSDVDLPGWPDLSPVAALNMIKEAAKSLASTIVEAIDKMIEGAKDLGSLLLPPLPKLSPKKLITTITDFFRGVTLPHIDIDIAQYLPGLPKLPNLPKGPNMPTMPKGPEEPLELELLVTPILSSEAKGCSLYVAKEIGWVVYAAASAYWAGEYYVSRPYENDLNVVTTMSSGIYNKTPLKGMFGKGTSSKPSGDGDAVGDEDL